MKKLLTILCMPLFFLEVGINTGRMILKEWYDFTYKGLWGEK